MSASRIASRYAKPILELAEEKKVLDHVKDDMENFTALYRGSRDFWLMLKSPVIPHLKKAEILNEMFKGKVDDLTLRAFNIVARKSREDLLGEIAQEFLHLYNIKKGLVEVSVTTSTKLDDSQRKTLEKLTEALTGKEPILEEKIDASIVGGFVMKLGDRQLDKSVSGQLKDIKLRLQTI